MPGKYKLIVCTVVYSVEFRYLLLRELIKVEQCVWPLSNFVLHKGPGLHFCEPYLPSVCSCRQNLIHRTIVLADIMRLNEGLNILLVTTNSDGFVRMENNTRRKAVITIHVTQVLETRLGLSASICHSTTRIQVMTRD